MSVSSNVEFSERNAPTSQDAGAGAHMQLTNRPPALAVRLPGRVEHCVERQDRDLERWRGSPIDRPTTMAERAFLAAMGALSQPSASPRLLTRVAVRGAVRHRTWPMLSGEL